MLIKLATTLILAIFSGVLNYLNAQDSLLFKILRIEGTILIDDLPAQFLQDVYSNSRKLTVGKKSQVGIITSQGEVINLKAGWSKKRYSVPSLPMKLLRGPRFSVSENDRVQLPEIECITCPDIRYSRIFEDSIFISWNVNYIKSSGPKAMKFKDIYDNLLYTHKLDKSWIVLDVASYLNQEPYLLLEFDQYGLNYGIKNMTFEERLLVQGSLEKIPKQIPDRKILVSAVFSSYGLQYDQIYALYQWLRDGDKLEDSFYDRYIIVSKNKYFKHYP